MANVVGPPIALQLRTHRRLVSLLFVGLAISRHEALSPVPVRRVAVGAAVGRIVAIHGSENARRWFSPHDFSLITGTVSFGIT